MKIGFMQGRLVKPVKSKIQEFPVNDWEYELELANNINLNLIEWVIDKNSIDANPIFFNTEYVKNSLEKNHIEIGSLSDDFFLQIDNPEIISNKILIHIENVFKKMIELEIPLYVLPLLESKSIKDLEIKEQVVLLNKIKYLVPPKIKICLETDLKPETVKILFESLDANIFKINYDIGNSAYEGFSYEDEFNQYFNLIENIHIKDRLYKGSTVPLGEGDAKILDVLNEIKIRGYKKNLILQAARINGVNDVKLISKYKKFVEDAVGKKH